jgi:uncharacterized membrane protein (UPF0127 family)
MSRSLCRLLFLLTAAVAPLFATGCEPTPQTAATVEFSTRFSLRVGGKAFVARIAVTDFEVRDGLMFQTTLERDEGMLFVFSAPKQQGFWMRNTPLDLDLAYIDASGRVDEIKPLRAHDPTIVESQSAKIRYVLEMPAGWFDANGLAAGARLELAAVRDALKARGFQVQRYVGDK